MCPDWLIICGMFNAWINVQVNKWGSDTYKVRSAKVRKRATYKMRNKMRSCLRNLYTTTYKPRSRKMRTATIWRWLTIFAFYTFSHLHFADSISHFIRCPFSHFRIFALYTCPWGSAWVCHPGFCSSYITAYTYILSSLVTTALIQTSRTEELWPDPVMCHGYAECCASFSYAYAMYTYSSCAIDHCMITKVKLVYI